MTSSKDLFLSVLAMDAYNRGYGAGISDGEGANTAGNDPDGLGEVGKIGSATILTRADVGIDDATFDLWQSAGFYALAYDIGPDGPEGLAA